MVKCGYCPQAPIGVIKWFIRPPVGKLPVVELDSDNYITVSWTVTQKGLRIVEVIKNG